MMMTDLKFVTVMPLTASVTTWPRTAAEAKEWCRRQNEAARRERERTDADHQRTTADLAKILREVQAETDRRQHARGAAPKRAPAPVIPAGRSTARDRRALNDIREAYERLNNPLTSVHEFYRQREEQRQQQLAALYGGGR